MAIEISALADTWNSSGTAKYAIKFDVTDTASATASKLLELMVASSSKFGVRKDGRVNFASGTLFDSSGDGGGAFKTSAASSLLSWDTSGNTTLAGTLGSGAITSTGNVTAGASSAFAFSAGTQIAPNGDGGLYIKNAAGTTVFTFASDGAISTGGPIVGGSVSAPTVVGTTAAFSGDVTSGVNFIARDGTNPCKATISNTYTSATNYEQAELGWASSIFTIATTKGTSGTQRNMNINAADITFQTAGANRWRIGANGAMVAGADGLYDVGASNLRPRDLWSSRYTYRGITPAITASTTQTQGQGAITTEIAVVTTVANANDTVTLPTAVAGMRVTVINNGANTLKIFPASGADLGAGTNTATTLAAGSNVSYIATSTTNWEVD